MLCEICRENKTSFIISISLDSSIKEIHVCEECATSDMVYSLPNMHPASGAADRECSQCHWRYFQSAADADREGNVLLVGCPVCYSEFREEITPLLRRIHGSITHDGKRPAGRKKSRFRSRRDAPSARFHTATGIKLRSPWEAEWMSGDGPECDVVISTRVRLARNVSGRVFCNLAEESQLRQIADMVEGAVANIPARGKSSLQNAYIIRLEHLDDTDREFLIERHLISRDLAERNGTGSVIVGEKEDVSIMLNEEDHIRLQVINAGLQIRKSWEMVNAIDDDLAQEIDYAFSSDWGYLTACPTNVGTGLRVSVMFHIPALAATQGGNRILSSVSDMGYAIRGIYGEGSRATGAFYQISNEATLGPSEEGIIDRMRSVAYQIVEREREERQLLIERNGIKAEDKILRSYGTLVSTRSISSREAQDLLSWVSLGVSLGMLSESSRTDIARLLVLTRPAHLQKYEGRKLDTAARDVNRAAVIRAILTGNRYKL